jgi:apolipoprotein D and lipocalin family protein
MKTLFVTLLLLVISCSTTKDPGQSTVDHVDLNRFMGNWYEIARLETPLQSECGSAKVTYKLEKKSEIEILHACHEKEKGKTIHAKGLARIDDKKTNAKWKVSYMPVFKKWHVFSGSLWIVGLDPEYQYAILGHPTHKHLWILGRKSEISQEKYEELVTVARMKGYKTKELIRVPAWK